MELRIKNLKLIIVFILLLSFLIRIAYILTLDNTVLIGPDAGGWDKLAVRILNGEGFWCMNTVNTVSFAFRPCFFPIFIAGIYKLFGHSYIVVKIFMSLVGAGLCLILYFLGRMLFSRTTGVIAGIICAVYPTFVYYSGYIVVDTFTAFLIASSVFLLMYSVRKHKLFSGFLSGLFFGFSVLSRSIPFVCFPFMAFWPFIKVQRKKALMISASFVFGTMLTIAPWVARNYELIEKFVILETGGGYALWLEHNPKATYTGICYQPEDLEVFKGKNEFEQDMIFKDMALEYIGAHPGCFIKRCFKNLFDFWKPFPLFKFVDFRKGIIMIITFSPVFILGIIGMVMTRKMWRDLFPLYALIICFTGVHIIFGAVTRYRVPVMPYIILFAAYTLSWIYKVRQK